MAPEDNPRDDVQEEEPTEYEQAVIALVGAARFAVFHATKHSTPFIAGAALNQLRRELDRYDKACAAGRSACP